MIALIKNKPAMFSSNWTKETLRLSIALKINKLFDLI